jgi:hypothetical protein
VLVRPGDGYLLGLLATGHEQFLLLPAVNGVPGCFTPLLPLAGDACGDVG